LMKGLDPQKDQSYFLSAIAAERLPRVLFPIGAMPKSAVRRIAKSLALPVHDKKDSTGICFIGERPFEEFLSTYLPAQPGVIETLAGERLGQHRGLMFYTLGQRQGLGIGGTRDHGEQPWYVVNKDLNRNALLVEQGQDHPALMSRGLVANQLHWFAGAAPSSDFRCAAKTRYRQPDQACRVEIGWDSSARRQTSANATVTFDKEQRAVTPGQFVVFYVGEECLGSGVISDVIRPALPL
ncbi:MAG: tRNA 2-thiouridine(34) synthase MnmA, partial [Candidatus Obscuribacterales bacterium]|nr:tRNA 2-thiouridine(34) synthase MnmA [Steroidobacteraceae bacterium]